MTTKGFPFAVFDEFGVGACNRVQDYAAQLGANERERCAVACDHFAAGLVDARLAEALRDMAAVLRALGPDGARKRAKGKA